MKKYLIAVVTLAIFSIPSLSAAADGQVGPYLSFFLGTSFAREVTVSSYDDTDEYSDQVTFDPGIYTGGAVGYDLGFMRLEGELSFRNAELDTVIDSSGYHYRNVDGDLGVSATMFNVFFDLHNTSRVTPYLGGGVGFANLRLSDTSGYDSRIPGRIQLYDESDNTVFACQFNTGMNIEINSWFSLDIGYCYFITEKANLDGDYISSNLRFESHNAKIGFNFKF